MSVRTAARVRAMRPDIVVLHSPHSICLSDSLGVYLNPTAAGSAAWMGAWDEFTVAIRLAEEQAKHLLSHLKAAEVKAEGIVAFASFDIPMRWSEAIPAWFLTQALGGEIGPRDEQQGSPVEPADGEPRFILLSEGCGGGTGASSADRAAVSPGKIPETLRTGKEIAAWAAGRPERIVFVGSVDLAHGHGNSRCPPLADGSGPDPRYRNPRYETPLAGAEPFDEAMQCWACSLDSNHILETAPPLLAEALACGYDGCVMMHGLMGEGDASSTWQPEEDCFHYGRPVYYGMMTAAFTPKGEAEAPAL